MAFKLKNFLSKLGSKANKEGTSFKAPSSGGDIKKGMDWKYGHGEFANIKKRRKPGESKFNYDVRMRKKGHKATSEPTAREKFQEKVKREGPVEVDWHNFLGNEPTINPNDKRDQSKPQNFGIMPGMSFGEAFAQAGKGGAQAGKSTFFWTDPDLEKNPEQKARNILYDLKQEEDNGTTEEIKEEIVKEITPVTTGVEEKKLRFPELGKYHYKNSPSYTGQ